MQTFTRDSVFERLLVVQRLTGFAVSPGGEAATDALVRSGLIALTTVDVLTVTRALGHHLQTAHRVVLLRTYARPSSQSPGVIRPRVYK